ILCVTCDNVSANDAMVSALADIISHYRGPVDRVQCLAHIINLVVQVILRQFNKPKKKKEQTNRKPQSKKGHEQHQELEDDSNAETEGVEEEEEDSEMDEAEIDETDVRDGEDDMVDGIEEVEAAMKQDMALADEHVKPMRQVLSKVSSP
ncbi:hypothetical protein B0F90DRAFT_1644791, partial [Multifurca ochricompacta]